MSTEDIRGRSNSSLTKIEKRNKKAFKAVLKKNVIPVRAQSEL